MKKSTHQLSILAALALTFTGAACGQDKMDLTLQVAIAVTDAAERAGVAEDAVVVKEARVVNWGSSAVGCPREDMNYMQVIVPGVLLLLEADGKIYRYHGEAEREPFYCPDDRAEAPAYGQGKEFM